MINNDVTNTFSFSGAYGYGPGKHSATEFLSSTKFANMASIFNNIGRLSGYNYYSREGHVSCFYGSIVFRAIDGTMSAFLDSTMANYGIDLPYNTTDVTTPNDIFNTVTNNFEIPLNDDLLFEAFDPFVRMGCVYNTSTLREFRPIFDRFSYGSGKIVECYLYDCFNNVKFDSVDYALLSDYDFRLQLFGFCHIDTEVL